MRDIPPAFLILLKRKDFKSPKDLKSDAVKNINLFYNIRMFFKNRKQAGQLLAEKLGKYKNCKNCIVLGLPRGGAITGYEIAKKLKLPFNILVVRKIGAPMNAEYAIGAISETGIVVWSEKEKVLVDLYQKEIQAVVQYEKKRIEKYQANFRQYKKFPQLKNKVVILADDGLATGLSMRAAILSCQKENPQKIVSAVPVAAKDSVEVIQQMGVELIGLNITENFMAVGQFYQDFKQVEDEEVEKLLKSIR